MTHCDKTMPKPRYTINFPAQMADCEANYYRLRRLMPNGFAEKGLDEVPLENEWQYLIGNGSHSLLSTETQITVSIRERAKYTSTVHILCHSHLQKQVPWGKTKIQPGALAANSIGFWDSELAVRMYHDAQLAEVFAYNGHRHLRARYEYPNKTMYQQDEKAQSNRFLTELLSVCGTQGRVTCSVLPTL